MTRHKLLAKFVPQRVMTLVWAPILLAFFAHAAHADLTSGQTITLPEDDLTVTVASTTSPDKNPLDSELSIWVGEVELHGRKTIWVELIDTHGEVIYDSEVRSNETHLLPDGRAVVVRALEADAPVVKQDQSRVASEGQLLVTRRVVEEGDQKTTVEFIEERQAADRTPLLEIAAFGESVWNFVAALFVSAANTVKVAWTWLVDTLHA